MGNICSISNKKFINDFPIIIVKEIEIKVSLEFLIAKSYFKKTEESKILINNQLKDIFSHFENVEADIESLFNKKVYHDIFSQIKEELDNLKLESYGIFEQNNFIEFTKTTIINHYCYLIENDQNMKEM